MKKILTIAASMLVASLASAQTFSDALTFGQNDYYGTARTLAMGNAVTAVGGDLGAVAVNPAGGSVAAYSQFSFSTGWSSAMSSSSYASSYDPTAQSVNYTGEFNNSKTRMTVPNIGMNLYFETGQRTGVKGWNFAFIMNRSQTYTRMLSASGLEGHTSMTGALAAGADGMPGNILANDSKFDSQYAWNSICAYDGGLINYNSDAGTYFGSAETVTKTGDKYDYEVLGWLNQKIGTTTLGSKNDLVINYGLNIDDRLFLGASINCPIISFKFSEYYNESAQDPDDFPVKPEFFMPSSGQFVMGAATHYLGSTYKYNYVADISGINLKLGMIWLPTDGLRIGAAFQTPTAYTIHERWNVEMNAEFQDSDQNASSESPVAETSYNYRAPYSANLGLAYTIGRHGMLSVDYELADFSIMKFSQEYADDLYTYEDPFYAVNSINKLFGGVAHTLRVGAEFRVNPAISLRAGINYATSPERYYNNTDGEVVFVSDYDADYDLYYMRVKSLEKDSAKYCDDDRLSFSCGVGYSSPGSFYADLAFRKTTLPDSYYRPYSNYLNIVSPSVLTKHSLVDAVITVGWRF